MMDIDDLPISMKCEPTENSSAVQPAVADDPPLVGSILSQVNDRGNAQAIGSASSSAGSTVQVVSDINAVASKRKSANKIQDRRHMSAKWQVQFPSGWQDLPPEASRAIEASFATGEDVATYEQCRSKKQDWWDTYQIDFASMEQTNIRSGRQRNARRIAIA